LELIKEFKSKKVLLLPKVELDTLLKSSEILIIKDTVINDKVRILKVDNIFLFQEITNKDEIALRKFNRLKDAEALVQDRLAVYENMWNGCGCKVNYYE
jgi:hypothetical protein